MFVINDYDINGKHTVLDDQNKPMVFETKELAREFLEQHGLSEEEIENLSIEEPTDEELEDTYVSGRKSNPMVTVGELREELAKLPDTAKVTVSNMNGKYFSFEVAIHNYDGGYDETELEAEIIIDSYEN